MNLFDIIKIEDSEIFKEFELENDKELKNNLIDYLEDFFTMHEISDCFNQGKIDYSQYNILITRLKKRKKESLIELKQSWEVENSNIEFTVWLNNLIILSLEKLKKKGHFPNWKTS
jgi:hypothetical protein